MTFHQHHEDVSRFITAVAMGQGTECLIHVGPGREGLVALLQFVVQSLVDFLAGPEAGQRRALFQLQLNLEGVAQGGEWVDHAAVEKQVVDDEGVFEADRFAPQGTAAYRGDHEQKDRKAGDEAREQRPDTLAELRNKRRGKGQPTLDQPQVGEDQGAGDAQE